MANKKKQVNAKAQLNERYNKYVDAVSPKSGTARALWNAFWIGGITCCIAQAIFYFYKSVLPSMDKEMLANITSMTVISIAIIMTGFGFYDVIARKGGAGSFLPITGFANAMVSASMEFKTEGLIFGTSTKMFTIVGPVVVNGVVWSTVAALISWLIGLGGM